LKPSLSKDEINALALELGFSGCRFTSADIPAQTGARLKAFIDAGYHGHMDWFPETFDRRQSPTNMWDEAKTAILLSMNYGPEVNPLDILEKREKAAISVYAKNRDYHDIIKGRLKQIAQKIASRTGAKVKVFVDTAPLMEKPLAQQAGLGWQGKHTNLVSREFGSWLFLGSILTDQEFEADEPETDHCGNCRACLDICPTKAFPAPYQLDARRCISYLTIEHHGPIPLEFRKAIGNRIYGCDDCLAVCPWNKFAAEASEAKLKARADLIEPDLADLVLLEDKNFRKMFSGSPIKRIGRSRFIRNVLIAIGNSQNKNMAALVAGLFQDPDPVIRGGAIWAYSQLANEKDFLLQCDGHISSEKDPSVLHEWQTGKSHFGNGMTHG